MLIRAICYLFFFYDSIPAGDRNYENALDIMINYHKGYTIKGFVFFITKTCTPKNNIKQNYLLDMTKHFPF